MMGERLFPSVEVGIAFRPRPGERVSGDLAFTRPLPAGLLVAVIDGLGHGPAAAEAAAQAAAALEGAPESNTLAALVERCHRSVRKTRGIVISLALLDPGGGTMSWLGVGNVEAVLVHATSSRRETLAVRPGVVGQRLPALRAASLPLAAGDALVLASDGLRRGLAGELPAGTGARQAAEQLLAAGATGEDDAVVLVARYLGERP